MESTERIFSKTQEMLSRFFNTDNINYSMVDGQRPIAVFNGPFGDHTISLEPFNDGPWFEDELVIYCVRRLIDKQVTHFLR